MSDMQRVRNGCWRGVIVAFAVLAGCGVQTTAGPSGGAGGMDGSSASSSSTGGAGGMASGGMGGVGGMASGGMGGAGGGGGGVILPPCVGGKDVVLVVDQMFLGDTDPDGTPNPVNGWKQYGFDIDNRASTKTSTDLCKPTAGGSPAAVYPDGINGIDNSFGKNVLPIFLGLASDMSTQNNQSIANGEHSYLFSLANVAQGACSTSSSFYLGGNLGKFPAFDGSDQWPIDVSSLVNPVDPKSAKCVFSETNVVVGLVKAEAPAQFDLHLKVAGFPIILPIQEARLRFQLAADQKSATGGRIGGIIATEILVAEIANVAAAFDTSFCDPASPTLMSILNQLRQASDIMIDGTQDPTKECNGISIGLGFTMKAAQLGPIAPATPPPADPCSP